MEDTSNTTTIIESAYIALRTTYIATRVADNEEQERKLQRGQEQAAYELRLLQRVQILETEMTANMHRYFKMEPTPEQKITLHDAAL